MPRISNRQQSLRFVRRKLELNIALASSGDEHDSDSSQSSMSSGFGSGFELSNTTSDDMLEDSDSYMDCDLLELEGHPSALLELYFVMHNTRYFVGREVTSKSKNYVCNYFDGISNRNFKQMVRMNKCTFFYLVELIQNNPVFVNKSWHDQASIEWQLAVTLDRLGHNGNGACLAHMIPTWGVSNGTLVNFTKRCFIALEVALQDCLQWPSAAERQQISLEFSKLGFPDCVGLIDGSTLPLAQRPAMSGECYFDRKCQYNINTQVVCDHRHKILFLFTGMAGSCCDLTSLKRSCLWLRLNNGVSFTEGEYLLGDSGYVNMAHMVAAFKMYDTSADKSDFNMCVAKCRVTNEHCIGVLKSRWHSLREIRIQLNSKKDNVFMVKWIGLCAKLHNYVIAQNDEWTAADKAILMEAEDVGSNEGQQGQGPQIAGSLLLA